MLCLLFLELDSGRERQSEATHRANEQGDRQKEGPTESADSVIRKESEADYTSDATLVVQPELVGALLARLEAITSGSMDERDSAVPEDIDPALRDQLEALGYLSDN